MKKKADVEVGNVGTIWTFLPVSDRGKRWIDDKVQAGDLQWAGDGIVVCDCCAHEGVRPGGGGRRTEVIGHGKAQEGERNEEGQPTDYGKSKAAEEAPHCGRDRRKEASGGGAGIGRRRTISCPPTAGPGPTPRCGRRWRWCG